MLGGYDAPFSLPELFPRPFIIVNGELDPRCPMPGHVTLPVGDHGVCDTPHWRTTLGRYRSMQIHADPCGYSSQDMPCKEDLAVHLPIPTCTPLIQLQRVACKSVQGCACLNAAAVHSPALAAGTACHCTQQQGQHACSFLGCEAGGVQSYSKHSVSACNVHSQEHLCIPCLQLSKCA
eukprot:scaffold110168_cov26-Tisochrysis_lutea.AAC.1